MAISPNMSLIIPTTGVTAGPEYANDVNSSLTILDAHTHSPGSGVQVTPSGLNINADLSMGSNNLTLARSVRFQTQASPLALVTDLGCLYESGVDLYYNDGSGNQIRITQSGGVVGSPGSISGLTSPASATYVSVDSTFVWQSAANTPANTDTASVILRNLVANSKGLTLSPPNAMAANYSLVLPSLPGSTSFLTLDSSGNISGSISTGAGITGSNIASATITGSNIANNTIANSNITPGVITGDRLVTNTITGGVSGQIATNTVSESNMVAATLTAFSMSSNIDFPGDHVREGGRNVVVSSANASTSLAIIRGSFDSTGSITAGEGFSVTHLATGIYGITYTTPFADTAVAIPCINQNIQLIVTSSSASGAGVNFLVVNSSGSPTNQDVALSFIAIGRR